MSSVNYLAETRPDDDASMIRCAVLGSPIDHSLSPLIHTAGYRALGLADRYSYGRIDCPPGALAGIVSSLDADYTGLSVTMPGKFEALAFADDISDRARRIGSANTLVRRGGRWYADNTDCDGVVGALAEALPEIGDGRVVPETDRAVIVGAGGTARPALWALSEVGFRQVDIVNRSDKSAEFSDLVAATGVNVQWHCGLIGAGADAASGEEIAALASAARVVISTVPSAALLGVSQFLAQTTVVDVIYDPWPTPLVSAAQRRGYRAVGGHVMLACQAFAQFELFTGQAAPRVAMRGALEKHLKLAGHS